MSRVSLVDSVTVLFLMGVVQRRATGGETKTECAAADWRIAERVRKDICGVRRWEGLICVWLTVFGSSASGTPLPLYLFDWVSYRRHRRPNQGSCQVIAVERELEPRFSLGSAQVRFRFRPIHSML